jgi:hypothetical protein
MILAAENNHYEIVSMLCEKGADKDEKNKVIYSRYYNFNVTIKHVVVIA